MNPRSLLAFLSVEKPISGAFLSQQFNVTRSAIWKQLSALRAAGAPIAAEIGQGYRLTWPFELLDETAISSQLPSSFRQRLGSLKIHWEIDSTNSELMRMASALPGDLHVCLAEIQIAGRGRRGRSWQSPLGGNIYFSLLKRFDHGMSALSGLSLAMGLATIQALHDCGIADLHLKWPNDILAQGRKLAGILVELGGEFLGPCYAVIGIGINWRLDKKSAMAIEQSWIDIAQHCASPLPSRNFLISRLLVRFIHILDEFSTVGFSAMKDQYASFDFLRGKTVRIESPRNLCEGIASGVDWRGALLVRHGEAIQAYDSADVTIRPL